MVAETSQRPNCKWYWRHGDFNQDSAIDEIDYALWESNKFTDLRLPRPVSDRVPRAPISTVTATPVATMPRELNSYARLSSFHAAMARVKTSRQLVGDVPRLETVTYSLLSGRRESWNTRHGKLDSARIRVDRIFADELADIMAGDVAELHRDVNVTPSFESSARGCAG